MKRFIAFFMAMITALVILVTPANVTNSSPSCSYKASSTVVSAATIKAQKKTMKDWVLGKRYYLYLSHTEAKLFSTGMGGVSKKLQKVVAANGGFLSSYIIDVLFKGNQKLIKKADRGNGVIVEFRLINGTNFPQIIDYYTR